MASVHINNAVIETLSVNSKENVPYFGVLLGQETKDGWHVTGCCHLKDSSPLQFSVLKESVSQYLSGGLQICGIFLENTSLKVDKIASQVKKYSIKHQNGLVICVKLNNDSNLSEENIFLSYDVNSIQRPTVIVKENDPPFVKVRLKCSFTLSVRIDSQKGSLKNELLSVIENLCNTISSASTVYRVQGTAVVFSCTQVVGLPMEAVCSSLLQLSNADQDEFVQGKQKHSKSQLEGTLLCDLLQNVTVTKETCDVPLCAPIIQHSLEKFRAVTLTLPIDVCCQVTPDMQVMTLGEYMTTALCNQLRAMQDCLLKNIEGETLPKVQPFHFQPWKSSAIITVIYPEEKSEEKLESKRRELHSLFCLSPSRPLFRRGNVYLFPEDIMQYGYLINPHQYITTQPMKGGQQSLVQGLYSYHHYMQDRFDDNMWGCAYRSLQTLVSWFRFQGYTDKPIPTHREIQQALVDVGDKEPKFVGSRQWIGSMEVSYCLDHLIGVTSRIVFVSEGSELATKGRELAQHFQVQGTPIMIGGGVLAHTILGVDFNEVTGDVKFLILDPHYTGAEDLKVILDKGWCGWKGMDFWDKTAHYNMCLPQRPKVI
ncbi:ufm1-specific protease 2-like isoform X2 [Saccostrea echinata]|uniref:ufm1-specific protease 2-like isoform X2 n=1 Tax=Saccostrea echinata TaxID=191078 RepID=UPI002A80CE5F|nr:ufm1-specific protease 2-like isoform X2 [Saccostrea echinata]